MPRHTRLLVAASMLAVGACSETTRPADGVRFSLYLTDAPGDVRVWASFSDIYLQGEDGRQSLLDGSTDLIEITALVGTVEQLVNGAELPMGAAGEIRAVVDRAVLDDGDGGVFAMGGGLHPEGADVTGVLRCPSCSESGIKIKMTAGDDEVLLDAASATLLMDFDVSQSFGQSTSRRGEPTWIMNPVIFGTLTLGEAQDEAPLPAGAIQGNVQLPFFTFVPQCPSGTPRDLSSFTPTATMIGVTDEEGNPVMRTGSTDAAGSFEIPFLAGGDYEMGQAEADFGTHRLVFNASVVPGSVHLEDDQVVTTVTYFINSMQCMPA